jgi:hypothetical protein
MNDDAIAQLSDQVLALTDTVCSPLPDDNYYGGALLVNNAGKVS